MREKSIYNIHIDFERCHGSYLFDKRTESEFLDFFGLWASLPLGYNHPIFQTEDFVRSLTRIAPVKVPNNELITDEGEEFFRTFSNYPAMKDFTNFHFCCTGALAVEAAAKVAIDQKGCKNPMMLSLKKSFHGINSYGGFLTDRQGGALERLQGLPDKDWIQLPSPNLIDYSENEGLKLFREQFDQAISSNGADSIAAFFIEPIQSTSGDLNFPNSFFKLCRELCDQHNICLVFDEIQTGFGGTGTFWFYEQTGIVPDIVTFGKKSFVSGIMTSEKFSKTFENIVRLQVTWDGSLEDMLRCTHLLKAFDQLSVLDNVKERGQELYEGLGRISQISNIRQAGLLMGIDFPSTELRDKFFAAACNLKFMCNKTADKSVRLRPNLLVSSGEVEDALGRISKACQ